MWWFKSRCPACWFKLWLKSRIYITLDWTRSIRNIEPPSVPAVDISRAKHVKNAVSSGCFSPDKFRNVFFGCLRCAFPQLTHMQVVNKNSHKALPRDRLGTGKPWQRRVTERAQRSACLQTIAGTGLSLSPVYKTAVQWVRSGLVLTPKLFPTHKPRAVGLAGISGGHI